MDWSLHNSPLSLRDIRITDAFWKNEMDLVRTEVIPYQWAALNDQVEGAAPSYCMRNFKIAGKLNRQKAEKGPCLKSRNIPSGALKRCLRIRSIWRINFTAVCFRTATFPNGSRL